MTIKENMLEYLKQHHVGADNALLGHRLCSIFGVTGSLLRRNINELRIDGHPVCSDANGYFYAASPEEIGTTIAHLSSRSREINRAKEGLQRAEVKFTESEVAKT